MRTYIYIFVATVMEGFYMLLMFISLFCGSSYIKALQPFILTFEENGFIFEGVFKLYC